MKAFTLSLIALPLLAAAAEDGSSFGSRGRHHVQRSQLYRGHRHRHHPSGLFKANSVAACGANTTDVETPEKLAEGSLDALHGCVEWHEIGSDDARCP